MNKRKLTDEEIEFIVDFVKPNTQIPKETAASIVDLTKKRIKKQLVDQEVYPEIIPELKKEIEKNYPACNPSKAKEALKSWNE
jgi:hypothetical protein